MFHSEPHSSDCAPPSGPRQLQARWAHRRAYSISHTPPSAAAAAAAAVGAGPSPPQSTGPASASSHAHVSAHVSHSEASVRHHVRALSVLAAAAAPAADADTRSPSPPLTDCVPPKTPPPPLQTDLSRPLSSHAHSHSPLSPHTAEKPDLARRRPGIKPPSSHTAQALRDVATSATATATATPPARLLRSASFSSPGKKLIAYVAAEEKRREGPSASPCANTKRAIPSPGFASSSVDRSFRSSPHRSLTSMSGAGSQLPVRKFSPLHSVVRTTASPSSLPALRTPSLHKLHAGPSAASEVPSSAPAADCQSASPAANSRLTSAETAPEAAEGTDSAPVAAADADVAVTLTDAVLVSIAPEGVRLEIVSADDDCAARRTELLGVEMEDDEKTADPPQHDHGDEKEAVPSLSVFATSPDDPTALRARDGSCPSAVPASNVILVTPCSPSNAVLALAAHSQSPLSDDSMLSFDDLSELERDDSLYDSLLMEHALFASLGCSETERKLATAHASSALSLASAVGPSAAPATACRVCAPSAPASADEPRWPSASADPTPTAAQPLASAPAVSPAAVHPPDGARAPDDREAVAGSASAPLLQWQLPSVSDGKSESGSSFTIADNSSSNIQITSLLSDSFLVPLPPVSRASLTPTPLQAQAQAQPPCPKPIGEEPPVAIAEPISIAAETATTAPPDGAKHEQEELELQIVKSETDAVRPCLDSNRRGSASSSSTRLQWQQR